VKTITLPADTENLYLDEVAHLIADCLNPEGPNDPDGLRYKGALEALAPELEQDANSGALRTRHPETLGHIPPVLLPADPIDRLLDCTYSVPLRHRVVTVPDFTAYVADRGMTVAMEAPAQSPATPAPMTALGDEKQSIKEIRYEVLASRTELIEAFKYYGVELKIFRALKDRPGLKAACRVKGKGQKGSRAEPMFCPFEVINWLVKTGVKEKPRLNDFMGWHILETKFPNVYAEKSIGDPRQN